jgi:hypothetical protein
MSNLKMMRVKFDRDSNKVLLNANVHSDDDIADYSGTELIEPDEGLESGIKDATTGYVWAAAAMAALGGILYGYDVGIISGALLQLRCDFNMSKVQQEWVISSMLVGAIVASVSGGFIIDFCGRRLTIIVNSFIFVIGAIVLTSSNIYSVLIIGRLIVGFGVSLSAIGECI